MPQWAKTRLYLYNDSIINARPLLVSDNVKSLSFVVNLSTFYWCLLSGFPPVSLQRFVTEQAFVSAHNSYSLSLVLLSVNHSSDKERATAAAHTPGAKWELEPGCLPFLCPSSDYQPHPSLQNPLLCLSQRHRTDKREYAMHRLWLRTRQCY